MDQLYGAIIEIAKLCLWEPIKQHTTYLLCKGQIVTDLQSRFGNLEEKKCEVQEDVDRAKSRGEQVRHNVQQWLDDVNNVKSEVQNITTRSENARSGCCLNSITRYGLGKEAAMKKDRVDELLSKGETFPRVARSPPYPTLQSMLHTPGLQIFRSTEASMDQVLCALRNDSVKIIAVNGMGGVGKTTLVKEVAKKAESERLFDKVVMVTVSRNVFIKKIQEVVGNEFGLQFRDESESVRAANLLARLNQVGKSLVILDDLWAKLELSDVGIPCGDDEHNRCKIVITTRSLDVCNLMNSQVTIEVDILSEEDSWNLFQANAGDVVNDHGVSDVAREVVKECKGLPLAIVVLGKALKDRRDNRVWKHVLQSLKKSTPKGILEMETQVFNSIKYSFDNLRSEEDKLCFLFCCLFPEDHIIDPTQVTHYMLGERHIGGVDQTLEDAENEVHHLMDNLKSSGLLLEGDYGESVKMHDIVRDVAIWVSKEEPYRFYSRAGAGLTDWPMITKEEECQRISLSTNLIRVLPEEPLFPKIRTLILSHNKIDVLPNRFFSGMQALELLDLVWNFELSSLPVSMSLLSNLRVLNLSNCRLGDISGIPTLKSLEILNLEGNSNIGLLSTKFGQLTNLRYLNLSETECMVPYGLISRLSRLEQLHMKHCGFSEWQPQGSEGDTSLATFAELACLPRLTTLHIHSSDSRCFTQELEHNAALKNLVRFSILLTYPLGMAEGNSVTIVSSVVPCWAKMLAERADNLVFYECPGIEWLASAIGQGDDHGSIFSNISRLELFDMKDLRDLCGHGSSPPDGFLGRLKQLKVEDCSSLEYALIFGSTLEHLEYVRIDDCGRLKGIFPSQLELLPNLRRLEIYGCGQLERVFGSHHASFPNLRTLGISDCGSLATLFSWRHVQSMRLLEEIHVYGCGGLVTLITSSEEGNSMDDAIGDKTSVLPRLGWLSLTRLSKITSIDEEGVSVFEWPSLEKITVLQCPNLKKLPLMAQSAPKLQWIEGSEEWFQALEWADESVKSRLQRIYKLEEEEEIRGEEEEED